jgi:hypothetical protein
MIAGPAALSGQARPASFIQVVRPEKLKATPLRCQPPRPSCYLLGTRLGRQLGFAEVAQYWQERDIIEQVGCGRLSASPRVLAAEDQLQTSRIIRRGWLRLSLLVCHNSGNSGEVLYGRTANIPSCVVEFECSKYGGRATACALQMPQGSSATVSAATPREGISYFRMHAT